MPVLLTFADSRLKSSANRLIRQAKQLDAFSGFIALDENSLDPLFIGKHRGLLNRNVRGFGFWIWKPQVILQSLRDLPKDEILVYLDVGCHLNRHGRLRLLEYFSIVSESESGILAFNLSRQGVVIHKEVEWSKSDTLDFFGALFNDEIKQSAQIEATVILIQKRESTMTFFEDWLNIMEARPNLTNDSISLIPNDLHFVDNRHDQSIFSLLGKREGISLLSYAETFPQRRTLFTRKPAWRDLKHMPIQARRDKARLLQHIVRDIVNGFKFVLYLRFIKRMRGL